MTDFSVHVRVIVMRHACTGTSKVPPRITVDSFGMLCAVEAKPALRPKTLELH